MKSILFILLSAGLALTSPSEICDGWVSPHSARGRGERGCGAVSGALCMNGSGLGYKLCGYHGKNCDGHSTRIQDDYGLPRAYIYVDGKYETINSYRVIRAGNC
ncbi:hypothetical protein BJX62DRAFT_244430 [Aspergillus germanicus]